VGEGGGGPPRALSRARRCTAGHPRQRGQSRRGDPRLAHLGRRLAGGARQGLRHRRRRGARSALPRAQLAQARSAPRRCRRSGAVLRLGRLVEVDGQHPERRRRQRTGLHEMIDATFIHEHNARRVDALRDEYESLGRALHRRGLSIDAVKQRVAALELALPTWGVGVGGTRFARFPIPGEPSCIEEKLEDCAVVQQLCRITPRVSPHFPWDKTSDARALREQAAALGLGFDAVNSNTFQDVPGQALSYRHGSLTHTDAAVRAQAIAHNVECIEIGKQLGSKAITVWIGDGTNFPGQQSLAESLDRYLESAAKIYAALPGDWRMLLEHKLYEPAFYSTVISDWGTSILCAQQLGP